METEETLAPTPLRSETTVISGLNIEGEHVIATHVSFQGCTFRGCEIRATDSQFTYNRIIGGDSPFTAITSEETEPDEPEGVVEREMVEDGSPWHQREH